MRIATFDRRIVILRYWQFTYAHYKLLLEIQAACPNQVIEVVGDAAMKPEDLHRYIPAHQLNLENYHVLRSLNAA